MSNYKQTTVSGESWLRSNKVTVDNPYNGTPFISFGEERAISLGDTVITQQLAPLSCQFDSAASFPALNPQTGDALGVDVSHGEVYTMLYSLYMHLANKRDFDMSAIGSTVITGY